MIKSGFVVRVIVLTGLLLGTLGLRHLSIAQPYDVDAPYPYNEVLPTPTPTDEVFPTPTPTQAPKEPTPQPYPFPTPHFTPAPDGGGITRMSRSSGVNP